MSALGYLSFGVKSSKLSTANTRAKEKDAKHSKHVICGKP